MYRQLLIVGAACASLAVGACGQPATDTDTAAQTTPDANPAATIPTPADETAAPDFVAKAGASDMFEIESSRLALSRSNNAEVKAFAQMMVDMHTQTTADLKAAIDQSGQPLVLPTALPEDMQSKLDNLGQASDADFDRAYMDAQVEVHQSALNLMTRYAADGEAPALKAAASKTAPIVQDHLTRATALRDSLR